MSLQTVPTVIQCGCPILSCVISAVGIQVGAVSGKGAQMKTYYSYLQNPHTQMPLCKEYSFLDRFVDLSLICKIAFHASRFQHIMARFLTCIDFLGFNSTRL